MGCIQSSKPGKQDNTHARTGSDKGGVDMFIHVTGGTVADAGDAGDAGDPEDSMLVNPSDGDGDSDASV